MAIVWLLKISTNPESYAKTFNYSDKKKIKKTLILGFCQKLTPKESKQLHDEILDDPQLKSLVQNMTDLTP